MKTLEQAKPNDTFFRPSGGVFTLPSGREAVVDENGVWKNRLGLESTETHRHVAKIWQDKCIPLTDFYERVCDDSRKTRDRLVEARHIQLTDDLKLAGGSTPRQFTKHGISTLLSNLKMTSTTLDYLVDQGELSTASMLLNRELRMLETDPTTGDYNGRHRLVRFRGTDGGGEIVRAVLSEGYTKGLGNQTALEMFMDAIPNGAMDDVLVSHLKYDGDYMCLNLILPDYIKDPRNRGYGSMLQIRNSEIGKNAFYASGGLFEAICLNGCIWGLQELLLELEQRHWGNVDMDALRSGIRNLYKMVVTMGNAMAEQAEFLTDVKVSDPNSVIVMLSDESKFSGEQTKAWIQGYKTTLEEPGGGNEKTGFGVWNGLTRGAQSFSGDTRIAMEQQAGSLLAATASMESNRDPLERLWNDINDRAALAEKRHSFMDRRDKLVAASN